MKSTQIFTVKSLVTRVIGRFSIATILASVIVVGCNRPSVVQEEDGTLVLGKFQESSSLQRGVTVGSRTLVIESETGAVTITGTNSDEASLLFTISARGNTQKEALAQIDKLMIEESGDETSYTYNVIPDRAELTRINVEGEIPRNASLRLILRNGDITLTNVDGTIEVRQENGSIVYLGGSESLQLTTLNGDVFADFYRLTSGTRANVNVANGDLSLGVPETSNVAIDARTRAGCIVVHDLRFIDQRLVRKGAGAVFKGKLGNGVANILLKTSNGAITFNRVSLSAEPQFDIPPVMSGDSILPDSSTTDTLSIKPATDTLSTKPGMKGTSGEGTTTDVSAAQSDSSGTSIEK